MIVVAINARHTHELKAELGELIANVQREIIVCGAELPNFGTSGMRYELEDAAPGEPWRVHVGISNACLDPRIDRADLSQRIIQMLGDEQIAGRPITVEVGYLVGDEDRFAACWIKEGDFFYHVHGGGSQHQTTAGAFNLVRCPACRACFFND